MEINATYWEKPQYSSAPPTNKNSVYQHKKKSNYKKELVGLYEKKSLNTFINF